MGWSCGTEPEAGRSRSRRGQVLLLRSRRERAHVLGVSAQEWCAHANATLLLPNLRKILFFKLLCLVF
eukprot:1180953-Prorocentrum_minimum.AAC.1